MITTAGSTSGSTGGSAGANRTRNYYQELVIPPISGGIPTTGEQ